MDDRIVKLASSESIYDIKALVQEQSNLILEVTEAVNTQKEKVDKLKESVNEFEKSFQVSKTLSFILIKNRDDLEQ